MSAFVEKAKEHLSNATGAAFRNEWELFDVVCAEFSAHLEAREAVTRQLADALLAIQLAPMFQILDSASKNAVNAALQAYDEANKS